MWLALFISRVVSDSLIFNPGKTETNRPRWHISRAYEARISNSGPAEAPIVAAVVAVDVVAGGVAHFIMYSVSRALLKESFELNFALVVFIWRRCF